MTRDEAHRKYKSLLNMTEARGCTSHEATTARRLAAALAQKWGFADPNTGRSWRPDFDSRFARAEQHAAARWKWEYRRCGKKRCWCARAAAKTHGPYKYGKRREGRKVRSIYMGR
jgi:hypothetical protein